MLRSIVTFLLLALTYRQANASIIDSNSYARSWKYPANQPRTIIPGTLFATEVTTFPVASCEFTKPNQERVCNVTLTDFSKPLDSGICRVKITADSDDKELFYNGYFQMIPFSRSHVVVGWYAQTKEPKNATEKKYDFKLSILNSSNCELAHLDFPIQKVDYGFFPALVTYDEQIDVIVNSVNSCGGADRCKLSFNLKGEQIGNVQPYKSKFSQYARAVSPSSPAKGFFQTVKDLSNIKVLYVNASGDGKEVLNANFAKQEQFKRDAYSNAHELYSLCWTPAIGTKDSTNISCSQFDSTGNLKLSKEMTFPKLLDWVAVHNLPKGGLLLATGGRDKVFHIYNISQREKSLDVPAPESFNECHDITSNFDVRISENDKDEVCFEFSCSYTPWHLKFYSNCYDKNLLL